MEKNPVLALPTSGVGYSATSENDKNNLVDALPYLDTDFNEDDRQAALQLIENECRSFRPTKNYLKFLPNIDLDAFLTPCLIKENARMAKKQEMQKLDMSRCELSCPSTSGRQGDKTSWRKVLYKIGDIISLSQKLTEAVDHNAIRNGQAQNEHLLLRNLNLELMEEYGPETLLRANKVLEKQLSVEEKQLRKVKEDIMNLHSSRRQTQLEAGQKLKELEEKWVKMVTKNYKMEMTCGELVVENETRAKKAKLI